MQPSVVRSGPPACAGPCRAGSAHRHRPRWLPAATPARRQFPQRAGTAGQGARGVGAGALCTVPPWHVLMASSRPIHPRHWTPGVRCGSCRFVAASGTGAGNGWGGGGKAGGAMLRDEGKPGARWHYGWRSSDQFGTCEVLRLRVGLRLRSAGSLSQTSCTASTDTCMDVPPPLAVPCSLMHARDASGKCPPTSRRAWQPCPAYISRSTRLSLPVGFAILLHMWLVMCAGASAAADCNCGEAHRCAGAMAGGDRVAAV